MTKTTTKTTTTDLIEVLSLSAVLELLATVTHGSLVTLHLYGVIWNWIKKNRPDIAIHGIALVYSGIACYLHHKTLKRHQNEIERTRYAEDAHSRSEEAARIEGEEGRESGDDHCAQEGIYCIEALRLLDEARATSTAKL